MEKVASIMTLRPSFPFPGNLCPWHAAKLSSSFHIITKGSLHFALSCVFKKEHNLIPKRNAENCESFKHFEVGRRGRCLFPSLQTFYIMEVHWKVSLFSSSWTGSSDHEALNRTPRIDIKLLQRTLAFLYIENVQNICIQFYRKRFFSEKTQFFG